MKKYLLGIVAVVLAAGLSAFTLMPKHSAFTTYYFKNSGVDKDHVTWVYIGTTEPSGSDCSTNIYNWCYGTSTSQTGTVTPAKDGDYIGL